MKKHNLPNPMPFEGVGMCYWERAEWRCPNKGEWFASGAIPAGYLAKQHLTTEYWVIKPNDYAVQVTSWLRAGTVQTNSNGAILPRRKFKVSYSGDAS